MRPSLLRSFLLGSLCFCFIHTPPLYADGPYVTQEIRYHMPKAGEVFLVWGIDGWQVVSEEMRPAGTIILETVMHTPMTLEGDIFITALRVPAGVTIDYGFLITKRKDGTAIRIWEADGDQDYHTVVTRNGMIEVWTALGTTQQTLTSKEEFSFGDLDIDLPWFVLVLTGTMLVLGVAMLRAHHISRKTFVLFLVLVMAANLRLNHIQQAFVDAFS